MTTPSQEAINNFVIAAHFDLPRVQALLAEQPELLNETAEWMETPIQAAAHVGNVAIAEYLLEQGAPLDICTAAMLGRADDVTAILADAPDAVQSVGAHNIPLLFFPIIHDHRALVEQLVAAGADINAGEGSNTPLHAAALFDRPEIARWLLDHDANPFAVDFEGKTPYDRAVEKGHPRVAELLKPFAEAEEGHAL
ncbi:MAG: ankyrin repeat domain-containing protein [Candidatus Flexifilum sp.]|jgi:ankyrin repeat protein